MNSFKVLQKVLSNHPKSREIISASLGAFTAILLLMSLISRLQLTMEMELLVLASMGASTFLLFVLPHSPMAQPWPLMAGHLIAAVVGVNCNYWIADPIIATATAVGLSVFLMHLLHALHPPAAATAIIAVIGLPEHSAIAWQFVYAVVIINAGGLLFLSLLINNLLPGRHYPQRDSHHKHHQQFIKSADEKLLLNEADFHWALSQIDTVIDVSETDLVDLYEFAAEHAEQRNINQKNKN
ncbi:HPP family protein [Methylophaga muralis]|uniref:HPP family protein n=1 Tax=Methylophaga muralis TaxID=291169 RepID=A0A1E3GSF2_9GAMM|nr:HPP family protein [Methylophaga muralis]